MKRLADKGLRYNQFHTTTMCSPTRTDLLTGRNHTTVGMGCITDLAMGFPGSNGHIPIETATVAEVLSELTPLSTLPGLLIATNGPPSRG